MMLHDTLRVGVNSLLVYAILLSLLGLRFAFAVVNFEVCP